MISTARNSGAQSKQSEQTKLFVAACLPAWLPAWLPACQPACPPAPECSENNPQDTAAPHPHKQEPKRRQRHLLPRLALTTSREEMKTVKERSKVPFLIVITLIIFIPLTCHSITHLVSHFHLSVLSFFLAKASPPCPFPALSLPPVSHYFPLPFPLGGTATATHQYCSPLVAYDWVGCTARRGVFRACSVQRQLVGGGVGTRMYDLCLRISPSL